MKERGEQPHRLAGVAKQGVNRARNWRHLGSHWDEERMPGSVRSPKLSQLGSPSEKEGNTWALTPFLLSWHLPAPPGVRIKLQGSLENEFAEEPPQGHSRAGKNGEWV